MRIAFVPIALAVLALVAATFVASRRLPQADARLDAAAIDDPQTVVLTAAEQTVADELLAVVHADLPDAAAEPVEETWRERELRELHESPLGRWLAYDEEAELAATLAAETLIVHRAYDSFHDALAPLFDRTAVVAEAAYDRMETGQAEVYDRYAQLCDLIAAGDDTLEWPEWMVTGLRDLLDAGVPVR